MMVRDKATKATKRKRSTKDEVGKRRKDVTAAAFACPTSRCWVRGVLRSVHTDLSFASLARAPPLLSRVAPALHEPLF